ncbi:TetR/AcrR family transcriptional regulator [Rhodococcus chondri]|uniref:TetR/AcrR family transcriptional regulator n=1 Tax=Rhodococcus chondri TaxID=3065941 RepID=A0ABU7JRJ8_9NOCA|nr:TetR/AcrR family transcriptional regulator [Rhodococcus sp. CC-R104]MEE2032129.1 TetR/AcrR family transcriptional regulator [Rhodococcus sp. CC-R104]
MPRQQERARRTRAAIVEAAAVEFSKRGYSAASINAILEHSNATKGAMYFHFTSKEELARAVLDEGLERYRAIVDRWQDVPGLDPFERLHGLIGDLAHSLHNDVIVAAEFKLVSEPEFAAESRVRGSTVWGRGGYHLAQEAQQLGLFRPGVDLRRFVEAVASSLAGQRYLADLTSPEEDVGRRFEACLEVPLEAMASQEWLERWRERGWPPRPDFSDTPQPVNAPE